uniref:Ig-like domain-containing protein n=1 Tax=Stegastes partitus TaxID=144197 RepID=A0A3B5A4I6_9TELE
VKATVSSQCILSFRGLSILRQFVALMCCWNTCCCCFTSGGLCQTFDIIMPQKVEALSGSCVSIPCRFTVPVAWESSLDDTCKAVWKRGWSRTRVFDSSLNGSLNVLQGNLTGNVRDKDCTTIFNNMPSNHNDNYYFRAECDNSFKYNFAAGVLISAKGLLHPHVEVEEGTEVILNCSTVAPCPALPPVLTWSPSVGDIVEDVDGANTSSVMKFIASHRHNGLNFTCTSLYRRQAGNSDLQFENSLTLSVFYSPDNTTLTYFTPVKEGDSVTMNCDSSANPAVSNYTWFKVNGGQATAVGSQQELKIPVSRDASKFYCKATNAYGTQETGVAEFSAAVAAKDVYHHAWLFLYDLHSICFILKSTKKGKCENYINLKTNIWFLLWAARWTVVSIVDSQQEGRRFASW